VTSIDEWRAFIGTTVGFPPLAIHSEIAECRRSWHRNGARRLATAVGPKNRRRNWYARRKQRSGQVNTKSSGPILNGSMWSSSASTAGRGARVVAGLSEQHLSVPQPSANSRVRRHRLVELVLW
jgi:hypothetical protein